MVSQIVNSNAYSDFAQPKNGYYLPAKEQPKKNHHTLGKTIAGATLVAGFGTLAIMKGALPKGITNILNKWKLSLETKIQKDSKLKDFYRFILGKIEFFGDKLQSINNFTSLKDVLFQKLMFGSKITRNIHKGITNFFDKISRKAVNSSYASTHRKFAGLNEYMVSVNEKILAKNPEKSNIISIINSKMKNVNTNLEKGFGINSRNQRLQKMKDASDDLFEYFWNASFSDMKNFRSKNMWQKFIAEEKILPEKLKIAKETSKLRKAISNNIIDNYNTSTKCIDNIQKYLTLSDKNANEILNRLRNNFTKYRKLSGTNEALERLPINEEILKDLKKLSAEFSESTLDKETQKSISGFIKDIENVISKDSKGELEEILGLYKQVLPRNEYLKMKSKIQSTVKSLDESIETETIKYFDKVRDLKLGSAPTDVLSILAAVGGVGWALGKSKDKDERISASLKYGIPAIGAIATSLYCAAKMISGGKGLAFGLLSGVAVSKVGTIVDNERKKYSLDVSIQNKLKAQSDKV